MILDKLSVAQVLASTSQADNLFSLALSDAAVTEFSHVILPIAPSDNVSKEVVTHRRFHYA
jgi:hypothetical protein